MIDENDPGTVPMAYPIGFRVGYARGTPDNPGAGQVAALRAASCKEIYRDESAAGVVGTPARDKALRALRRGDTLVVAALDRLGGSLAELVDVLAALDGRGVDLKSLDELVDTADRAPTLFQLAGSLAGAGRTYAAEQRPKGRKPRLSPADVETARAMLADPKTTVADVCRHFGVSRQTLHAHLGPRKGGKTQPEATRRAR